MKAKTKAKFLSYQNILVNYAGLHINDLRCLASNLGYEFVRPRASSYVYDMNDKPHIHSNTLEAHFRIPDLELSFLDWINVLYVNSRSASLNQMIPYILQSKYPYVCWSGYIYTAAGNWDAMKNVASIDDIWQ